MEKDYRAILRKYWGYDDFRGIQQEVIESIAAGHDTLCLMPTGGGKSITFQVPALAMQGVCLVFTPLISLMRDQVESLKRRGIKAAYITHSMGHDEVISVLENSIFGAYKFLYISPERLGSRVFQEKLKRMKVCFIAVDEAHCICQWGYDFRPSYLNISLIRDALPDRPILALTATATPQAVKDIQRELHFRKENVLKMSFARKNLAYIVRQEDSLLDGIIHALQSIEGSCIVYTRSRRRCQELSDSLNSLGFTATYYHAGMKSIERNEHQERWLLGEIRVMVATNAFGMGIDKADVRLVVHADMPDSVEAYFQEAGRAGRDGFKSFAILLTDGREQQRASRRIAQQFPSLDYVRDAYELVCCFLCIAESDGLNVTREFNLERFCRTFGYYPSSLIAALDLLDKAGYLTYDDEDNPQSRLRIDVTRTELFRGLFPSEERLLVAVLRRYGGIFVDYVYLDEDMLGLETGMSADEIYHVFTRLAQFHFVSYIPRRHLPRITFCQRRIDKQKIQLPRAVYDDRRAQYVERIGAMLRYIDPSSDTCRSRMLLRYFGEDAASDCGCCDVCRRKEEHRQPAVDAREALRRCILGQLREGPKAASDLNLAGHDASLLEDVVDAMRASGEITFCGSMLKLATIS